MKITNLILVTWFRTEKITKKQIDFCNDRKELNDKLKDYINSSHYLTHTIYINENCL